MDFTLYRTAENTARVVTLPKDSATVIRPGTFITLDGSGLAIEADATSAKLAYSENGAVSGTTSVDIFDSPELYYIGTADAIYAAAMLGTEVDLVINGGVQEIDVGASTTDVLLVSPGLPDDEVNVVGSTDNVVVKINKFLLSD